MQSFENGAGFVIPFPCAVREELADAVRARLLQTNSERHGESIVFRESARLAAVPFRKAHAF